MNLWLPSAVGIFQMEESIYDLSFWIKGTIVRILQRFHFNLVYQNLTLFLVITLHPHSSSFSAKLSTLAVSTWFHHSLFNPLWSGIFSTSIPKQFTLNSVKIFSLYLTCLFSTIFIKSVTPYFFEIMLSITVSFCSTPLLCALQAHSPQPTL